MITPLLLLFALMPVGAADPAAPKPVAAAWESPQPLVRMHVTPDPVWQRQAAEDARIDRKSVIFNGQSPNRLACDTTLRRVPDGSWVMVMLGGGDTEPMPRNRVFITRSRDDGKTWSPVRPIDLGVKAKNPNTALVPSELMVHGRRCVLLVATHDGTFANWKEWMTHSDDSCRTWSKLEPAPGRLHDRTFIRNHIVTRDGRILLPFQHYLRVADTRTISKNRRFSPPTDPRNGVLMSKDGGKTWTAHGNIRISSNNNYHGWAENNIVELSDDRIAMLIRADGLGSVLYYAESTDGGRTWPPFARKTTIPNPGSKATLYSLGGDAVALLHNPNPKHRSPLALWISFDGMKSWPYQRVLVAESCDGARGRLNYPDGFVSADKRWLHFAFDDNRHCAVYIAARLPALAAAANRKVAGDGGIYSRRLGSSEWIVHCRGPFSRWSNSHRIYQSGGAILSTVSSGHSNPVGQRENSTAPSAADKGSRVRTRAGAARRAPTPLIGPTAITMPLAVKSRHPLVPHTTHRHDPIDPIDKGFNQ